MTSPGVAWDAMLKMTEINLELISDTDMQLFIEKGLRRGISYIAHRYGKVNNKYMKDYNPEKKKSYLFYLDANNLYGWAMSQTLPPGDFQWLDPESVNLDNYTEESEKGLILEVDLEYPEELHHLHKDYPCAPEKIVVTDHTLSDYPTQTKKQHKISSGRVAKLVKTLRDKEKYVLHYRNLELYLELGLKSPKDT